MYTDEDLNTAIEQGIFTQEAVNQFRTSLDKSNNTHSVDEENFRLIGGFNDIFIVIACALFLFSSFAAISVFSRALAVITFPLLAWGLAEYFVRKRKMALPAIALLLTFVGGVFAAAIYLSDASFLIATAVAAFAAYLHYHRFHVPITIAAGTAAIAAFLITLLLSLFPSLKEYIMSIIFISGVTLFVFAMYWDASDRTRETRHTDIAFWLHLLSAPLIVHPIFISLGIFEGIDSIFNMSVVVILYILMSALSIIIDRRAFMVSSLVYVLYAISSLFKAYGIAGNSFALTGVTIGASILLLSAFWHPARNILVKLLPAKIQNIVPDIK